MKGRSNSEFKIQNEELLLVKINQDSHVFCFPKNKRSFVRIRHGTCIIHGLALFHHRPDAVHPEKIQKMAREKTSFLSRHFLYFHYAREWVDLLYACFIVPIILYDSQWPPLRYPNPHAVCIKSLVYHRSYGKMLIFHAARGKAFAPQVPHFAKRGAGRISLLQGVRGTSSPPAGSAHPIRKKDNCSASCFLRAAKRKGQAPPLRYSFPTLHAEKTLFYLTASSRGWFQGHLSLAASFTQVTYYRCAYLHFPSKALPAA